MPADTSRWKSLGKGSALVVGPLDLDAIEYRLISMRKSIGQLESFGSLTEGLLAEAPQVGLVAERIMYYLTDLAYEINCMVARVHLDRSPQSVQDSTEASFAQAVEAGLIDAELASRLHPEDGPHHFLLQRFLDGGPTTVESLITEGLTAFAQYTLRVEEWMRSRPSDEA